jgi:hypothetical protein
MPDGIRIVGLDALRRDLAAVDRRLPGEVLGKANKQAAEIVATDARRRAPRGPHQGGGRVESVTSSVQTGGGASRATVSIGGPTAPHAEVIEFGGTIPRRGSDPTAVARVQARHQSYERHGLAVTRIQARPYLYPAIYDTEAEVTERYAGLVAEAYAAVFRD